ncbi:MAG TPA: hypothetical protein VNW92_22815 [Polyangiaceae bacterium]|nr:hypothetical protein [Polyangiaceae bacterium]
MRARDAVKIGALYAAVCACDDSGAAFTSKFASDFVPARHSVSLLGVYQDGRMAPDSWDALAPYFTQALGSVRCAVGFDALVTSNHDLADAIDEYAREDGPTDALLTQLAPAAEGDLVLVLTYAGKLPEHARGAAGAKGASAPAAAAGSMGGRHRRGQGRGAQGAEAARDTNELDISASLFSVAQRHSVAFVGMRYSGSSVAEALTKFAAELTHSLQDLKCVGWDWKSNITVKQPQPPTIE